MATAAPAAADGLHPCARATERCDGTIEVPLDWRNPASERISVAFAWVPRSDQSQPATGTILHDGGGPGPAIPGVPADLESLGPVLRRQNLLVVDPRGFGRSSPLKCEGLDLRLTASIQACAERLDPRVRFFGTDQDVADLDAVREALGVPKVTFYGNSYGTLTAQAFATRFPGHTAAVFLDSVVLTREDGYGTGSFADEIRQGTRGHEVVCERSRPCRALAAGAEDRLATLVRRLRARPDPQVRLDVLATVAGLPDDPVGGRELVAAVAAYLLGDTAPLRRLLPFRPSSVDDLLSTYPSAPADLSYECGDLAVPFDHGASAAERRRQVDDFYAKEDPARPFTVTEAFGGIGGDWPDRCVHWPTSPRSPVTPGASYPAVPVLAVGGQLDANTPGADAVAVAARFPRSTAVEVPFGGHASAFGTGGPYTECVRDLMRSFLAEPRHPMPSPQCTAETYRAVGTFPRTTGEVPAARGPGLRPGAAHRIGAAFATLADALARRNPQAGLTAGLRRQGGLRGGVLRFDDKIRLDRVRFVADLAVTGTIRVDAGDRATAAVQLSGGGALRLSWRAFQAEDTTRVTGTLDGRAFSARIPLH